MKKTKRLAILLTTAVMAFGAMAFSACVNTDNNGNNGSDENDGNEIIEVDKSQWHEWLKTYDSVTITVEITVPDEFEGMPPYTNKRVMQIDSIKQIYYKYEEYHIYSPYNPDAIDGYITKITSDYFFCYNDYYFTWSVLYGIHEIGEQRYNEGIEYSSMFSEIFEYSEDFTYNSQTGTYECVNDEDEYNGLQFFDNGNIKILFGYGNQTAYALFENINSTTITLPDNVKDELEKIWQTTPYKQ